MLHDVPRTAHFFSLQLWYSLLLSVVALLYCSTFSPRGWTRVFLEEKQSKIYSKRRRLPAAVLRVPPAWLPRLASPHPPTLPLSLRVLFLLPAPEVMVTVVVALCLQERTTSRITFQVQPPPPPLPSDKKYSSECRVCYAIDSAPSAWVTLSPCSYRRYCRYQQCGRCRAFL